MLALDFTIFPQLVTERLVLRHITAADVPAVLTLRGNETVMQYIDRPRSHTDIDAHNYIQKLEHDLHAHLGITWGIALLDEPAELIGTIGYWRIIREHYRAEISYLLHPDHWQKGIMKEAIHRVLAFGFNEMGLHTVEAQINPGNWGSAAILEATGFIQEGYFRENYCYEGVFKDTRVYTRFRDS